MMHVALISSTDWLDEEVAMLRHLVVGLLDEGVRVVQIVPETVGSEEFSSFGKRVTWRESRMGWLSSWRLSSLSRALGDEGLTVVHALDSSTWRGAMALAARLNLPNVLSIWSADDVMLAQRAARARPALQRPAFIAPTAPLGKDLTKTLGSDVIVQVTPPGVHVTTELGVNEERDDVTFCAVVSGDGNFDTDYEALFTALRPVVQKYPQAQFFLEGQGHDQHPLWQAAKRFGLLANISMVPLRLTHRDLLLRADVLIMPQALGVARTLPLQVMARGKPVLARVDPWLDYLVDQETAWLVDQPTPQAWEALLMRLIERAGDAVALGASARQWVSRRHIAAKQVAQMLALYRRVSGEGFKFPAASAG
jgi:glycosyltransferase involved in cell wall biosynthesis